MVAPSLPNVAGYHELVKYIDDGLGGLRSQKVQNSSGATIAAGSVVYLSGSTGTLATITKAKADALITLPGFGILPAAILNGQAGLVQYAGLLPGIDTSVFVAGDRLYVSAATAGLLTKTEPVHPNISQLVAIVITVGVTGTVFIYPATELHGAEAGTLADTFKIGAATAGAKVLAFVNAFIGSLSWTPTAARTLTLPDATDTLTGKATVDILTNKTFDTAGAGNVLKVNGTGITDKTGTGKVALDNTPTLTTPNIGAATGTSLTVTGGVGKNGAAAQGLYSIGGAATDLASVITLANNMRLALNADGTTQT